MILCLDKLWDNILSFVCNCGLYLKLDEFKKIIKEKLIIYWDIWI